ncbi:hypothetical protein GQ600_22130 [Phytophthora cactorum]|nr:hypothetical protein GQ600_22130 [Phytophthora cactorum]
MVTSKNEETRDAKRPKVEDGGYELALGGGVYIDMDKLFKCPALKAYFNKKYKRSVAQLIKQEKFCVIYATKNGIAEGVLHMKTVYAPKSDARLVKKGENSSSLDLAPPVITDEDLSFFVDKAGTRHHVEMRGMRTMEGIFFKAKDVGLVFKSDGFLDTVQRQHTAYSESVDYIWFTLLNPNGNSRVQWSDISTQFPNKGRELFLTFGGPMHALHSTRTQVATEFRKWVYTQVFAIAYGTPAQKRAMIVPSDISCLYLIDTTEREDGKKVYKFGRSKKLKERFYQHSATFGDKIVLDTIVFVPQKCLSEAEALLNYSIAEDLRFHLDEARELLLLDPDGYKVIRTIMQTRPKVEDGGYELALGGGVYIDMDKLFKCPALKAYFNKKYKRSVAQLIKQEKFCVIYATKNGIAEGVLHMKTVYAPKSDARLVKKGENVERIIMLAKSSSLDLAPPVITDEDLSFFVDKAGTRHHVEMRGMRTMEGIFFKAKDVGLVFKSDGFLDTVQRQHTAYSESVDYIWFTLLNPNGNSRSDISTQFPNKGRELFLTFGGPMHALHSTRTQVATEFRKWVYTQVFAIAYGTPAQKRAMIVPSDISCLYLIDTTEREDGKKVYKFGRSKKLKERFYQHSATFGDKIVLDTIVFVPQKCLSEAEALLNHSIAEDLRFHLDEARELLLLDPDGYKVIRTIMQTRPKVEDGGYELALGGGVYIDMDKLFKCPALKAYFNKKYKRSVAQLIKQEKFCVIYATKNGIAEGVLHMKTVYAPKSDARLVKKGENVERIIMLAKSSSLDLAPPVITDEDLSFFVDKAGTRHHVEMRGMRTMEGIFFKAKDVGLVFKSDGFLDTVQRQHTAYSESVDYIWFTLLNPNGNSRSDISTQFPNKGRELFLTFGGPMHALHSTRTQVATEFRKWVYTQVFAIAYGTPAQKRAMIVPSDISCLYLIDTTEREDGKKVYKFGRSKKLKERFYQHSATFGDKIVLDTIVFVPQKCLSEAEALLNHSIAEDLRFHLDEARELLLLDPDGYKVIRTIMQTRPKVEDGGYELALGGGVYIDMDKLFKCPALKAYFNKKYKRSVAQLIKQEKFCVIYATKNGIAEGVLHMKTVYAPKSDARLVKKGENVERIIMLAKSSSLDLAPPVITDEDLSFFVDKAGTRHHVEMRGMRTMEGIFFKAKDVGLVFKSDGFLDTVQRQHTAYSESVDYIWFTLLNPNGNSRSDISTQFPNKGRELFLTFGGPMHALHSTRTQVATEFRKWVYTQVFAIAYGTPAQKRAMIVPSDISCLYLIDTTEREDGKKVYKFGRSKKLKERFYQHSATFGDKIVLDTIVFVPQKCLSEAEALLNHSIAEDLRFHLDEARELLLLDPDGYKVIRTIMQTYDAQLTETLAEKLAEKDLRIAELEKRIVVWARTSQKLRDLSAWRVNPARVWYVLQQYLIRELNFIFLQKTSSKWN